MIESLDEISGKEVTNKVSLKGEEYHTVKYIIREKEVKEITVVDGDKIDNIAYNKADEEVIGWFKDKELTEEFDFNKKILKDTVLYGKLKEQSKVKVTYVDEGNKIKEEEIEKGVELSPPTEVEDENHKTGYKFKYWSLEENGEEYNLLDGTEENITLYAVYEKNEYTIKFIDGEKVTEEKVLYNESIDENKIPVATKEHYNFIGWSSEEGNTNKIINVKTYKITNDITLYSVYEIEKYNIEFYDENGVKIEESSKEYEATEIVDEPLIEVEHYIFKGWKNNSGREIKISDSLPYMAFEIFKENEISGNDLKLYANLEKEEYTIKFIDEEKVVEEKVLYNDYIEENKIPNVSKEYYDFIGWSTEKNNSEKIIDIKNTKIVKNMTLYSTYSIIKYNVSFYDENGRKIEESSKEYEANQVVEAPNVNKNHYNFVGWNTSSDKTGKYINFSLNKQIHEIFEENELSGRTLELHAIFEPKEYTIIYNNDDGSKIKEEKVTYSNVNGTVKNIPTLEEITKRK